MSYNPDNDAFWDEVEPTIRGYSKAITQLLIARQKLLAAFDVVPQPPEDIDTDNGRQAYCDAILLWLDTTCTEAIDGAKI